MRHLSLGVGLLTVGLSLILFASTQVFFDYLETPGGAGPDKVLIVSDKNDASSAAELLIREGLVRRPAWMRVFMEHFARPFVIRPGEYALSANLSPIDLMKRLGSGDVVLHTVTIGEGMTTEQIAERFAAAKLVASASALVAAARDPSLPAKLGLEGSTLDGYLTPEVYALERSLSSEAILSAIVERYRATLAPVLAEGERSTGVRARELLSLSALIALSGFPEAEWPNYSAMLHNRRRAGLPLETPRAPLGLPAVPLANPGLRAAQAAAHPARSAAKYAVARPNGTHVFCDDVECRDAARRTWASE